MRPQDLARERTCFEVLRSLAGRTFVLVGGFAISAYGFRRFSVDLDLVLPASEVDGVRTVLRPRGFVRDADRDGTGMLRGRFERWIRRDVAVLAKGALDMEALWGLLSPCPPELLRDHLTRLRAALGTREFQDSVKGVFVLTEPTYREIVRTAEAFVAHLLAGLR